MSDYRELAPPAPLAEWVACGWLSTRANAQVLPDGCADIVWTGERLIVAGPATRMKVSTDAPDAPKVGVRFRVGAAGAALGLSAGELRNCDPLAADVVPGGAELAARCAEAETPERALVELTTAVAARLRDAAPVDPLVRAAALAVARAGSRVRDVAREVGLSERQLRRRFEDSVGYGPKTLARVLRLQRFLHLAERSTGDGLAWLAADAGYADQAHLARDCAALAGAPQSALLAQSRGPAGERLLIARP
jgi:AraC-like DNA-binding protein